MDLQVQDRVQDRDGTVCHKTVCGETTYTHGVSDFTCIGMTMNPAEFWTKQVIQIDRNKSWLRKRKFKLPNGETQTMEDTV